MTPTHCPRKIGTLRTVLASAVTLFVLMALPCTAVQAAESAVAPLPASDYTVRHVCPAPAPGYAGCLALELVPKTAAARAHTHPLGITRSRAVVAAKASEGAFGLRPQDLHSIYDLPDTVASAQTIALVDAYNDPNAASDLETFSKTYGLPAASFTQVNQTGGSSLPATNSGWDLEISLDIEWAHALAPGARILLVEASTNSLSNLLAAENYAAEHASYVSNSWGSSEFSSESSYDSYFTHPGVSYFAAAGDTASSLLWPSVSPDVISAGGTSLALTSGGTLAQESAWSEGGGGCSRYESPNLAQQTGSVNCAGRRATPDVSLDADPNSGVSVYDSVAYSGQSGWWTVGGTSASTVMLAADAAANAAPAVVNAQYVYAKEPNIPLRDIILGSNGHPALTGFDLATGLGSWSYTPGAPTGLTATRNGSEATLSWSAPTGAQVGEYKVWRGTASGAETEPIATVSAPASTYTDKSATGGATYYYEVQAINAAGPGPFSNQAVAAGPSVPPVASFSKSCSGATCSFKSTSTDESGTIDAYGWSGGNEVFGSTSTFSDTYSSAGKYTVTLTVTNTAGQSSAPASKEVKCETITIKQRGRTRTTLTCS